MVNHQESRIHTIEISDYVGQDGVEMADLEETEWFPRELQQMKSKYPDCTVQVQFKLAKIR